MITRIRKNSSTNKSSLEMLIFLKATVQLTISMRKNKMHIDSNLTS